MALISTSWTIIQTSKGKADPERNSWFIQTLIEHASGNCFFCFNCLLSRYRGRNKKAPSVSNLSFPVKKSQDDFLPSLSKVTEQILVFHLPLLVTINIEIQFRAFLCRSQPTTSRVFVLNRSISSRNALFAVGKLSSATTQMKFDQYLGKFSDAKPKSKT